MRQSAIENLFVRAPHVSPAGVISWAGERVGPGCLRAGGADPEGWWASQAEQLRWMRSWDEVCRWDPPHAVVPRRAAQRRRQLPGRHVDDGHGDEVAYHREGEPGDTRSLTYTELRDEVARFAHALKGLGVAKGDRSRSTCR